MQPLLARLQKKQTRTGYYAVVASLLVSYALWIGSMWYFNDWYENPWYYLAKAGSHGATLLMCWSFILATRFRPVERLFGGLDEVYQAHRYIGEAAFFLIFLHPLGLATSQLPGLGNYASFFLFSDDWVRNTGLLAILGFVFLVTVSVFIKIRYHVWKQTHHFFGLLFALILVHGVMAQGEIMKYPLLLGWFGFWSALAVFAYAYIRLLYRWIGPEYAYEVSRTENRPDDVTDVYLKPRGRRIIHREGQFIYIKLITDQISDESHPFSISSAPGDAELRLSIKRLGDWTSRIEQLREGTTAKIWGPYGRFALGIFDHPERDVVLIGGGIGITPFLSIIRSPSRGDRTGKTWMIYSATDDESDVYGCEIAAAAAEVAKLNFVRHLSDDEGYITPDYLREKVGPLPGKLFFICGPAPMMESIQDGLLEAGVPLEDISTEDFNVR
jgi:predicted ferric reductase